MGSFNQLWRTAKSHGWHVLVTTDQSAPRPRINYDTIDVVSGSTKKRRLVDREPVVDGRLDPAAARLLERLPDECK